MQVEHYDELLKQVYRAAPIGLCLFDTELRYRHINAWLAEINGLSVERHLGRSISEVLPDVAEGVEAQLRRVIETGEPVVGGTVEAETAAEPGVKKHFEHHYHAVRSSDCAIVGVSCVVQDVTERMQAEEALRLKTDQLRAVSDAMIAFLDSGNWQEASATILRSALDQTNSQYGFVGVVAEGSTLRILAHDGIEWDDVIGRELYDQALRDYDRVGYLEFTSFENLFGKVITSGRAVVSNDPPNDPRSGGRPPGHPPLRHFLGVPIFKGSEVVGIIGVANRPGGYMGTEQEKLEILCRAAGVLYDSYRRQQYEDALEQKRKRAEEALRLAHEELENRVRARTEELLVVNKSLQESEERLRLALEAISEGVWDWNIATGEMFYSPQWCKALGFDPSEVEPHGRFWEGLVHPEDLPRFTVALNAHFEQKTELFECEVRLRTKSGEYRWNLDRGKVVTRDEDGKPLRMVGVDVDITERKRAQEELRRNRDDMQVLARRLISAHEDERRRLARELHDDLSQRLASIAIDSSMLESEIRAVSESGADKLAKLSDRIRETSVDVHQVSRQLHPSILDELGLVKALQAECNAFQRRSGIALRFEAPAEYSSVAKTTELALYRIMQECLRNIEKHSRAVSACVTLHVNEAQISLTVTDTGTGFDPTQQREVPGLGMASLKERAGLLGGTVSIQSEIGHGTTVTAHLPAKTRER